VRTRLLAAIGIAFFALASWACWPRSCSFVNYWRVCNGMTQEQVEALLGPGEEEFGAPQYPPYYQRPDAPGGEHGVVWGDRYFRWQQGPLEVYIGYAKGLVCSKELNVDGP